MNTISSSPPRAPPIAYNAPHGTRWAKEKAAAGGAAAFDLPTDPKNIGPWIIGECVGKGASGRVKIARHQHTGQLAAIKILPLAPLVNSRASLATQQEKSEKLRLGIDREITMMKLMNHPNILRIYDVYEGSRELFLVLEYVEGGELFDFLVNRGRLPPDEALAFFKQIIYGLNYAHTFSIIHRDLKPENILISSLSPPLIKIADWGMAAFAPPSLQLETSCGSPHYASPEIVNGEKYQGNATDIWSCGVILFALLTGRLPFDDKNVKSLLEKVKTGIYCIPSDVDPLAKDLIMRMLVIDVNKRITIPEILSHPWLKSAASNITGRPELPPDTPSLPPSPSTLARPISDPSLIDPDLLASLLIIWGRHADPSGECIKQDLCSPAGYGIHAKAFYFLLGKYREETSKSGETNASSSLPIPGMPSFNLGWQLDTGLGANIGLVRKRDSGSHTRSSTRSHHLPQKSSAGAPTQVTTFAPPLMTRGVTTMSRDRPPSPGGPRAQPSPGVSREERWSRQRHTQSTMGYSRPMQISKPSTPSVSTGPQVAGRPQPQRGQTYACPPRPTYEAPASERSALPFDLSRRPSQQAQRPRSTLTYVDSVQRARRNTAASTSSYPTPIPARSAAAPPLPVQSASPTDLLPRLPILAPPQTQDSELQKTMDEIAERVNELVVAHGAAGETHRPARMNSGDKENRGGGEEDEWSHVAEETASYDSKTGGDRQLGKEVGNTLATNVDQAKVGKAKDKKRKPPPLDFPSSNHKRTTLAGITSPPASPHLPHTPSNRLLTSPVVGEFKGWFSHLFGWKNQPQGAGVLYSTFNPRQTCYELSQFLQGLGIFVEGPTALTGSNKAEHFVMRCHVDEAAVNSSFHLGSKSVRFHIQVGSAFSPQPFASPVSASNYLSAPVNDTGRPRSRATSVCPNQTVLSGSITSIMLVHEKGSMSAFKIVWKKLKERYSEVATGGTSYPCLSPTIGSTPVSEYPQRFTTVA